MSHATRELSPHHWDTLRSVFLEYERRYRSIPSIKLSMQKSFVDGDERNITDARWIDYEGVYDYFGEDFLDDVIPLVVLNCLVTLEGCVWKMVKQGEGWEYGVIHPMLRKPVTVSALAKGDWLETWDFDETPAARQLALESYDDIRLLLVKKRIGSGRR